jgi:hypothetical protein
MKNFLRRLSTTNKVLLAIVLILVGIRILIPYAVKHTLNWYLDNEMESYKGHIADFDLSLYRGAYQIEGLRLWKKGTNPEVPLVYAGELDVSLAWRALLRKEILADLRATDLQLNFVDSASKDKKQTGAEEGNWNDVLMKLIPIDVESLKISDGQIHFLNKDFKAPIDVFADDVRLSAFNLRNIDNKNEVLPSTLRLTARLQKDAELKLTGKFNAMSNPPAFKLDAEMKEFDLQKLNALLLVYGPFTFARGKLTLYAESAAIKGQIKGYVKPFLENIKMVGNQEQFVSFKHGLYEFLIGASNLLLRDDVRNVATKVEFQGDMKSPDIQVGSAVWTALKNAFGTPVKPGVEQSIGIKDVPTK